MEQSVSDVADAYDVSTASLARALGADLGAVEAGLARLVAANLITLQTGGPTPSVSMVPVPTELGIDLASALYREFLEREGYELGQAATFYLENIEDDIEELGQHRPADPRVHLLASEYQTFKAKTSVGELMAHWLDQPKAIYAWLGALAAFLESGTRS